MRECDFSFLLFFLLFNEETYLFHNKYIHTCVFAREIHTYIHIGAKYPLPVSSGINLLLANCMSITVIVTSADKYWNQSEKFPLETF